MAGHVAGNRPLKSVAALEKLTLGNEFILRIAEERSRQSVERAEELAALLAKVQEENALLRAGGGPTETSNSAGTIAMEIRIAQLEAEAAAKDQELQDVIAFHAEDDANTVALEQHERVATELATERAARESAASARDELEAALSLEQAETAALQSRLSSEQATAASAAASAEAAAAEAAAAAGTELAEAQDAAAKAARVAEGEMADMQARLAAAQQASDGTDEAAASMLEESLALRGELREAMESREADSRKLEAALAAAERAESEVGNLKAVRDALKTEHDEVQAAHAQGCKEVEELRSDLGDAAAAAEATAATNAELVAAQDTAAKAAKITEAEAAALRASVVQLEAEAAAKDQELQDVIAFHAEDDANTVALEQHERVATELATERAARESAASARDELEAALSLEQAETAALQSRLSSEQATAASAAASAEAAAAEAAAAAGTELAEAQDAAAKAARVAEGEMADMQARLAAAQQASDGTDEAAASMLEESLALRGELREAMESREADSRKLEAALAAAERAESEVGNLKAAQVSALETHAAHIAQLEATVKDKDEEMAVLMEFNESVPMDEHEQVTSELRQAVDARATAETAATTQQAENESQAQRLQTQQEQLEAGEIARSALEEELETVRAELAQAEKKNSRKRRAALEPESEVSSPLDLKAAGGGSGSGGGAAGVRAFCIEQADDYIAAAIGRLVQLGATGTEGIFRVPGSADECAELEHELEETQEQARQEGGEVRYGDLRLGFASCVDVFAIATVTSRWLRARNEEEAWIPATMRTEMQELSTEGAAYLTQTDASAIGEDAEADAEAAVADGSDWSEGIGIAKTKELTHDICRFVSKLPERSERVVAPLLCFLRAVDDHASETKMNASNLATVLTPSLISQQDLAPEEAAQVMATEITFCTLLIRLYEPPPPSPWLVLGAPSLSQEPLQLAAAEAGWTAQRIELAAEIRDLRDQLALGAAAGMAAGTRRSSVASVASSHHSSVLAEGIPPSGSSGSTPTAGAAAAAGGARGWNSLRAAERVAASGPRAPGGAAPSGGFNVLVRVATEEDLAAAGVAASNTTLYHLELWKEGNKITSTLRRYSEFDALRKRCVRVAADHSVCTRVKKWRQTSTPPAAHPSCLCCRRIYCIPCTLNLV